jgi:hypothetical protein
MTQTRLCEICKQEIDEERAEHLPDTRLCGEHGREITRYGGEFVITASQERTSKAGSMKINYGGVSTSKVRNRAAMEKLRAKYEAKRK